MRQKFRMNQTMQYVIYGAGGDCYHTLDILQKVSYKVTAIIDKRAKTIIHIKHIPVYTFENYECPEPNKTIFIVTIKNVFEHIDIVKDLLSRGYCNFIYKPLPILQNKIDEEWNSINNAYEYLIAKRTLVPNEFEIAVSRYEHLEVFEDNLFISSGNHNVMCWLPIELIFNYNTEDAYGKMHMAAYYPIVNLYKYLLGQLEEYSWEDVKEDFLLYAIEWAAKSGQDFTNELVASLLHSRISIFEEMQKKSEIDKDFFLRNSVDVTCGNQFQFYMVSSGRNRIAFMIAKGYRYVPVRMSEETYRNWLEHPVAREIKEFLNLKSTKKIFTTIPHPLFVSAKVEVQDYARLFSMIVLMEIYRNLHWQAAEQRGCYKIVNRKNFLNLKKNVEIYISISDEGGLRRCFLQEDLECFWEDQSNANLTLNSFLNRLFCLSDAPFQTHQNIDYLSHCNILIHDSRKVHEDYLNNFNGNIIFLLMWETQEEYLGAYIQKGFYLKKYLFHTLWNEQNVSGVMLVKE